MRCRLFLVVIVLLAHSGRAPAGILFGRKSPKPTPAERVPELIGIVKNDGDENKRLDAINELRQYDATQFPTIVPVLIEVLQVDKKPAVRAEAALSLGRLRPISQEAGQALEQAHTNDPSMRVRLQARRALLEYHWSGYRSGQSPPLPNPSGKDPPAVNTSVKNLTPAPGASASSLPPLRPQPVQPSRYPPPSRPTTAEPPLAPPAVTQDPLPMPATAEPAPSSDKGGPDLGSPPE